MSSICDTKLTSLKHLKLCFTDPVRYLQHIRSVFITDTLLDVLQIRIHYYQRVARDISKITTWSALCRSPEFWTETTPSTQRKRSLKQTCLCLMYIWTGSGRCQLTFALGHVSPRWNKTVLTTRLRICRNTISFKGSSFQMT